MTRCSNDYVKTAEEPSNKVTEFRAVYVGLLPALDDKAG